MAKLHFHYSTMNAGKSTLLLQAAHNYRERGMEVFLLTARLDTRAGHGRIGSRIGLGQDAETFGGEDDLFAVIAAAHGKAQLACVFIDEAQFLTDKQVWQLARVVDDLGLPVMAYGLRVDFRGQLFPGSAALLALADSLREVRTICHCGRKALCVDDGSTDATYALLRTAAAADPRIRVLENPGKGPSDARNHGAAQASGELLAFCDADDLWATDKLAALEAAFADPACDGAFGRVSFFERRAEDARSVSSVPSAPLSIPMLLGENPVCTMSNIGLRARVFAQSGGLRREMVHNEDLDWLIRLVGMGARIDPLDRILVHYRVSRSGLSADIERMRAGRAMALESAACFGFQPDAQAEAVHLRYLARRALRVGLGGTTALGLALRGLALAPARFLTPMHRGCGTLAGALIAPALPAPMRRALFSR